MVSYSSSGHTNVRLDYIRMQFVRTLRPYGASTFFRSLTSVGNASRFVISEANSNTLVFDDRCVECEESGSRSEWF